MGWENGPLVGLDFETTGVDPSSDRPVQAAVVWSAPGRRASEVVTVDPGRDIPDEAVAIHGITTEQARREGCPLAHLAHLVHLALSRAVAEGVPVVAMNASFDLTIAERLFEEHGLRPITWRRILDPLVLDRHLDPFRKGKRRLDALCRHYDVSLLGAHDAGADAGAAIELARAVGRRFPGCARTDPARLTELQARWHAEWATSYDRWRREQGLAGLEPEAFSWPLRGAAGRQRVGRRTVIALRQARQPRDHPIAAPLWSYAPAATASVAIPFPHAASSPAGR